MLETLTLYCTTLTQPGACFRGLTEAVFKIHRPHLSPMITRGSMVQTDQAIQTYSVMKIQTVSSQVDSC